MHDPYILVFGSRFFDIWHRDRGGSDGACGWSFPHISEQQMRKLKNLAWHESHYPYFLRYPTKTNMADPTETETLFRSLRLMVADAIGAKMTFEQGARYAATRVHMGGVDGFSHWFCFLPGYHSNYDEDRKEDREKYFLGVLCGIARTILRERRPWYRHPRWHIWHWRIVFRAFGRTFGSSLP